MSDDFNFDKYNQSRISVFDEFALHLLLQKFNSRNLLILEIGSWLGAGSTQILSQYAEKIVCVDHWQGSENKEHKEISGLVDPYAIFQQNTKLFSEKIITLRCDSSEIRELISDQFFDFIFIDGDHRYSQTRQDIIASFLKLKENGVISGHDCEGRITEENRQFILKNHDEDCIDSIFIDFKHIHPGVMLAVDEIFSDYELFSDKKYRIRLKNGEEGCSSIWFKCVGDI